jgi:hypothetical protein
MNALIALVDSARDRYKVDTLLKADGTLVITALPFMGGEVLEWVLTADQARNRMLLETVLLDIQRRLSQPAANAHVFYPTHKPA